MKICTDPMYPKCCKEEETAHHFLGKCGATMMAHYSSFGSHLNEINKLHVQPHTFLRFARASKKIYLTFLVILGLCTGRILTTGSAALPEGKGN